ncbi:CIS tube protein [Flavilitoribacter nigricans]|uniref:Contractile injection system tube protein N-terminal domain-containing protein n=1 Tax=Flavilitoribacter nigricans (strain ATCC 23147 / DSM 23189 / NBRC 102662 / NCIMB 1420 / SS-2) TaxID=1122177 RepID=A0A2D0MYA1_FLAN2|nr:hypothetical protein [Flavilitoribacter nigricans]PHN01262.1 hypothetical protein CRP01_37930 [Flavilitoribacter nigricans DSM 23189 = NBRC 102662]
MTFESPNIGKLEKLKIIAIDDSTGQIKLLRGCVMVNPASFKESYEWHYNKDQASGTTGSDPKFIKKIDDEFSIPVFFDSTGTMPPTILPFDISEPINNLTELLPFDVEINPNTIIPAAAQLQLFLAVTGNFIGKIHRPFKVAVYWGAYFRIGFLKSLDVDYTLFSPSGAAKRIEGTATFISAEDTIKELAKSMISSPDLSHHRVVKEGDTLLLLCEEIYGDASLHQEVARHNGLTSFRTLRVGSKLAFPPIEK